MQRIETPKQRTVTASPSLAISIVVNPDGPKAIAFGAVDTGNMKAYEQTYGSIQHPFVLTIVPKS
jgi:hypothetical protein